MLQIDIAIAVKSVTAASCRDVCTLVALGNWYDVWKN